MWMHKPCTDLFNAFRVSNIRYIKFIKYLLHTIKWKVICGCTIHSSHLQLKAKILAWMSELFAFNDLFNIKCHASERYSRWMSFHVMHCIYFERNPENLYGKLSMCHAYEACLPCSSDVVELRRDEVEQCFIWKWSGWRKSEKSQCHWKYIYWEKRAEHEKASGWSEMIENKGGGVLRPRPIPGSHRYS